MLPRSEYGAFRCEVCGFYLERVLLPMRSHPCRPKPAAPPRLKLPIVASPCAHRGELIETIECRPCPSRGVIAEVLACDIHGRCHLERAADNRTGMDCRICEAAGEGFEPIG